MWAHLVSDTSVEELHAFAKRLGVPPRAFERDHYDIPADLVPVAESLGAHHVRSRDIVRALLKAGLRRRKNEVP